MKRYGGGPAIGKPLTRVEAAVETLESALAAERDGADRIELCANLDLGGTTPGAELIATLVGRTRLPVFQMIRPRGGGFVYSDDEVRNMIRDIEYARGAGITGVVTGALTADGQIDVPRTRSLVNAAAGLPVTFHRAFDSTRNLADALEQLIGIGVTRVLTSGGATTALEGAAMLASLVVEAAERIEIIAGGGIREHNVRDLIARTGVREVHSRQVRGISRALSG